MSLSFGLKSSQTQKVKEVLKAHAEIKKAVVFGSRAKDTHRPGSDIDLALFGAYISHKQILQLKKDLNDLNLPYKFDPVIYSEISEPALKKHIDRAGEIILEQKKKLR